MAPAIPNNPKTPKPQNPFWQIQQRIISLMIWSL
jgi:hypothetical protein